MEAFIETKILTDDLNILNIIRIYLKAATVSDIATSSGKFISCDAWNSIGSNNLREDLDLPRQPPEFTQNKKLQTSKKNFVIPVLKIMIES